jgi:probable F420-dependent oxidoreductase
MEIGIFAPLANPVATPDYIRTLGRACEERGFASLWMAEHVVLFDEYASSYPYSEDGKIPAGGEVGILEPFTAIAFLAGVTRSIRLGTGICLVPQRNPVYTAKDVTACDWLSDGRLDFGIGIGWLAEEFEALDVPFERRGARTRAYIEVMKRLWSEPVSQYEGEFYRLPACRQYPKPLQQPHPPIHVGGESDPALRRVAAFGQGWYGYNITPEQTAERREYLARRLDERGRSIDDVKVSICPYLLPASYDDVAKYRDAGVDQVILFAIAGGVDDLVPMLDALAESVVEPAKKL